MWTIAIAALIVSAVQLLGYRQAMLGREALGRVQARWAARAGIEQTIAVMALHTEVPVPDDAFALIRDMEYVSADYLDAGGRTIAGWDIRHHADGREFGGPMDEHSKLNINDTSASAALLLGFDNMTADVVDAIQDWIDPDDEVRGFGAERDYYLSLAVPYEPRNGPLRSVTELELVAGIWPEHLRGEDWNLNNRLDANEDDGDRTWPMDEPDQRLDSEWSALFTTYSVRGGPAASGGPRIRLGTADPTELAERLDMDQEQAAALVDFGKGGGSQLEQLLTAYLQRLQEGDDRGSGTRSGRTGGISGAGSQGGQGGSTTGPELTLDQLKAVFAETTVDDPARRTPGKLNINTVSEDLLRQILFGREHLADEIAYRRNRRVEGITNLVDLLEIPAFQQDPGDLEFVARLMDTTSNVYSISSRGRSWAGGVEVEIIAVVDRSTLPVRILEYREQ